MALPIYNVDLYEAGKKQWKDLTPEGKIFHALLHGAKATSGFANTVGERRRAAGICASSVRTDTLSK